MHEYKVIDINTWARKNTFDFFRSFQCPCFDVTFPLNVEKLYKYAKEKKYSFFALMLYALHESLDAVPEFRQRLVKIPAKDGGEDVFEAWEFARNDMMTPILLDDNSFCQVLLEAKDSFAEYRQQAEERFAYAREHKVFHFENRRDVYNASCMPWFKFTSLKTAFRADYLDLPLLSWDKMDENYNINLAVHVNHTFVDGFHIGLLVKELEKRLALPESL
ncbi:MAG: hypothetical protein IKD08_02300 [Alphaproteobacteria bacterium]|nr:hypothetical protein [Alphaproteobacteria bacterium]